ncbi:MAG: hypothetical protein AB7K71_11305 [Polyangiaceae bacterium]
MAHKTPPQFNRPEGKFETVRLEPEDAKAPKKRRRTSARTEVSAQDLAALPDGKRPEVQVVGTTFPPAANALDAAEPPPGRRTPARPLKAPDFGGDLPRNAPGWMRRARRMALALEAAIQAQSISDTTEACIERAWSAWELNGSSDAEIAHVSHIAQRAHTAIRNTPRAELAEAVNDCAEVLWNALPAHVLRSATFEQVVEVVRGMKAEADPWTAVLDATCSLLGWTDTSRAHAAQAIRIAVLDHPPSSSTPEIGLR